MSYSFGSIQLHSERALVLLDLMRFPEAEQELRQALAVAPNDAQLHAWLAYCLNALGRRSEAKIAARQAIGLAPEFGYAFYVLSVVCCELGEIDASLQAVREALRLEPDHAGYYQVLAQIYLHCGYVDDALQTADAGLRCDPRHVRCANIRATALIELGRRDEALATLDRALADNPEYYRTHENRGRLELLRGDVPAALKFFREALRLNPNNDAARLGLVEALKSRNVFYRGLLWLFESNAAEETTPWFTRGLAISAGVGAIFGLFAGIKALQDELEVSVFVSAFVKGTIGSAMFVWVLYVLGMLAFRWYGQAFFTVLLLADRAGRRTLTDEEAFTAKLLLAEVPAAVVLLALAFVTHRGVFALAAAAVGVMSLRSVVKLNHRE